MKTFNQYITELFEKPAKWNEFGKWNSRREASFTIDEMDYEILVLVNRPGPDSSYIPVTLTVEFSLSGEGGVKKGVKTSITQTGNASKVLSTVIDYLKYLMKEIKPEKIVFTAREQSRQKLYFAIAKRMKKLGLVKSIEHKGGLFRLFTTKHGVKKG